MTVYELMRRLIKQNPHAEVVMCMDWTEGDDENKSGEQWEDGVGDVGYDGKRVMILNEHFK